VPAVSTGRSAASPAPSGTLLVLPRRGQGLGPSSSAVALAEVDLAAAAPRPTGLAELDRVLGGGLVPGSVTLIGGEPGVGKSTLLLQVLRARASTGVPVLLVCAEESARQVRLRAERLGPLPQRLYLLADTDVAAVPEVLSSSGAELVVVDSVQAVRDPATTGPAGSVAQVRACAELLVSLAKASAVPMLLVGHVTKDGSLAGPRLLEHLVDTVLTVEGDRHHALRTVQATKHRFGPTGELGLFEMGEAGLAALTDPYRLLLGDRRPGQAGSVVLPAIQGRRALLVEVQALVTSASYSSTTGPRRQAQGVDGGRLAMLLAVLDARAGLSLRSSDVFVSVVGGVRVVEPAADLAVVVALASAARKRPPPPDLVAFGEVGLGGEVRQVPDAPRRLAEAARLGFRYGLVPTSCPDGPAGMRLLRVGELSDAAELLDG
jgi:DNA repair protein RadA/Sms